MSNINTLRVNFLNPMIFDRILELSKEYSVSTDVLINISVKKLIDDVDLLRDLRTGKVKLD